MVILENGLYCSLSLYKTHFTQSFTPSDHALVSERRPVLSPPARLLPRSRHWLLDLEALVLCAVLGVLVDQVPVRLLAEGGDGAARTAVGNHAPEI